MFNTAAVQHTYNSVNILYCVHIVAMLQNHFRRADTRPYVYILLLSIDRSAAVVVDVAVEMVGLLWVCTN